MRCFLSIAATLPRDQKNAKKLIGVMLPEVITC
jgi:hypothetical protein